MVVLPTPPFWLQTAIVLMRCFLFVLCFTHPHDVQEPARVARRERALAARDELNAAVPRGSAS